VTRVYRAANLVEAQLVVDELAASGLQAEVTGHYLSGAIGELPPSDVIGVRVFEPADEKRARALIEAWETERRRPKADWYCSRCQERLGGAFGSCWNCGQAAPS